MTFVKKEIQGRVAILTLNRPEVLNALSAALMAELEDLLEKLSQNEAIGAVVLTGSEKAFAAGVDISEMKDKTYPAVYTEDFITRGWEALSTFRKPVIAAVSGYALGGGAELAMMCDLIIAADTAQFGQPEITLGILPGMGGTQRLAHAIGKAKAMDLCLTGRMMGAEEAERCGLVSRLVPGKDLMKTALEVAEKIAGHSLPATLMAKEAVGRAFETSLQEGLRYERRLFHATFATQDQKEGMNAFLEKRPPNFKHG